VADAGRLTLAPLDSSRTEVLVRLLDAVRASAASIVEVPPAKSNPNQPQQKTRTKETRNS
jgi:hypothetical protein